MKDAEWGKNLENLFAAIGLSEKESRVYRVLLEAGDLPAGEIIKKARLKRGITYAVLYNLEKDGLVLQLKKGKKTSFRPEPPQKLADLIITKKNQIDHINSSFSQLLPKLSSQYKLSVGRPTVQYFEGEEGIKEVFEDIYAPKKEPVYGAIDVDQIEGFSQGFSKGKLIPSRLASKLSVKVLFNDTPLAKELHSRDRQELRESILLDKTQYPLPAEIEAYEDKVALMSFKRGEFIGLIIHNQEFATTLKSIFAYLFDRLGLGAGEKPIEEVK